jgi:hypothetical protein
MGRRLMDLKQHLGVGGSSYLLMLLKNWFGFIPFSITIFLHNPSRSIFTLPVFIIFVIFFLPACSNNNAPTADNVAVPDDSPETLQDTLALLGVNTEVTPRLDKNLGVVDESYAPMGRTISMMQVDNGDGTTSIVTGVQQELFLAGLRTQNCLTDSCLATLIDDTASVLDFENDPSILYQRAVTSPWINEDLAANDFPETLRDATGADVDADGRSEIIIVYFDSSLNEVHISIADSDAPGAPVVDVILPLTAAQLPVADLRIVTGNFDNDVEEELAIGIASHSTVSFSDSRAYVLIVDGKSTNYSILNQMNIAALDQSRSISLVLESAQLDFDGEMELVVVQNEIGAGSINVFDPDLMTSVSMADAEAFYTIFDDVSTTTTVVKSGYIEANVEIPAGAAVQTKRALIADVVAGDTDDDTLDEIFFSGLVDVPFSGNCDAIGHLLISLDDKANGYASLTEAYSKIDFFHCPDFSGWELRFADINLLDIDGDGSLEIQLNQFIFDTAPTGNTDWDLVDVYDPIFLSRIMFRADEGNLFFDRTNHVITVGDVTGDGREDIITYLQGESKLKIYGIDGTDTAISRLDQTSIVPSLMGGLERINPIIVPMNADRDTSIYNLSKHEYAIAEPVVLGVLAAPPCQISIGQNLDNCTTTWGQASSIGIEREKGFSVSAGATLGISADTQSCAGVGYSQCTTIFEVEVKATLEVALDRTTSDSYELTKSIAFTTGPIEDSVVYAVLPIDTYYYSRLLLAETVLDGGDVDLVVTLPREPLIQMTQLSYYNNSVINDEDKIPDDVFQHIAGEISTYPNVQQKNKILADKKSQLDDVRVERFALFNPVFDDDAPLDALQGLDVGPIGVGQGSGSTELGLDLSRNSSLSVTHEINFTFEANVAVGPGAKVLAGYTLGAGAHHMLNVSKGSSTSYSGTIGSIDAENFVDNQYQFGLFTYLQANTLTGIEFEVINYWVE